MGATSWPMSVERSWLPKDAGDVKPVGLIDVMSGIEKMNYRIPLLGPFETEVARVLGSVLVPGLLVLIGGDPGSERMAALIADRHDSDRPASVVCVSGEDVSFSDVSYWFWFIDAGFYLDANLNSKSSCMSISKFYSPTEVRRMDKRVSTAAKLGYKDCIVPMSAGQLLISGNW
ncbi:hypothetical protein J1N35_031419 [Gossypium stocksii]|uniref:Uncharacterized protein n=1 Tax=Gossypium stocksii TaxID=47602 RepID=A0A9D3V2K2_9ROSI|nr:hypothetical protein J1N35_031419 [Gossypium stocksii]